MSAGRDRGTLAILLHTHMPYVEGFGTWPFGEEWLWEAMAGSYLPLLEVLDSGAPVTLSLTPVLCDQLAAPGIAERFTAFIEDVRAHTHAQDAKAFQAAGERELAREIERSHGDYTWALERFAERCASGPHGNLLDSFAPHVQWTSTATHAVLPLLATDAGVRLQLQSGVGAHRERFGAGWRGGFWLPECGYAPWLGPALWDAGARSACVELTSRFGLGASEHLRPLQSESGLLLVPIDRATMSLVWSDRGYPAAGGYRDYHRHSTHQHNPWSNDGRPYDHDRALALAREDAADFVARTRARLRDSGSSLPGGGLAVCALDTELLGHWWYEGVSWLDGVIEECDRQGLQLARLDDALERHEPAPAQGELEWEPSSWGEAGGLSTWSAPAVADMAFAVRAAELAVLAAGGRAGTAAVRELLALQASDWTFMVARGLAVPYARERFAGHNEALLGALSASEGGTVAGLGNLAVHAETAALLEP